MRHKKLKLCALLLFGFGLTGLKAQKMYVWQTIGTQTVYTLESIKSISFSSGDIAVSKYTGSTDIYELKGLRYLNFEDLSTDIVEPGTKENTMLLYPNPVVDLLNIQLSTIGHKAYFMEIISIEGRVVYQEKINHQSNVYQINVSAISKGLYLFRINNGTATETTKFLKH